MNGTAGKLALAALAIGIGLGGCATRESVRNAQASADMANGRAGQAQARADEAYGVGNNALGVGNDARTAAMTAQERADQNATDVKALKRRVAYLEHKVLPHRKHHRVHRHHVATPQQDKPNNS
jgi:hypothetical protein